MVVRVLVAAIAAHEGPEPCLRRVVLVVDLVARQQAEVLLVPLFRLGKVWHLTIHTGSTSRPTAGGKGGEQVERCKAQHEQQEKQHEGRHEGRDVKQHEQ